MAELDPKLERLTSSPVFSQLGRRKLEALAPFTDDVTVPAGTTLMEQGSFPHELEVIVEGGAAIQIDGNTVKEVGPGDIIGEMALIDKSLRSATVVTTEATKLVVISGRAFASLMDKYPEIAEDLKAIAASRREQNTDLAD